MSFIESVKGALPDYAKDTKLNLDAVLLRSTLDTDVAMGCAVAALAATGNGKVLAVAGSTFVIAISVLVIRYSSAKFPSDKKDEVA